MVGAKEPRAPQHARRRCRQSRRSCQSCQSCWSCRVKPVLWLSLLLRFIPVHVEYPSMPQSAAKGHKLV